MRQKFTQLQQSLSLKGMIAAQAEKKQVFNPLAPPTKDPQMNASENMKEMIKQDVVRTN
jgi:hypothetical protein